MPITSLPAQEFAQDVPKAFDSAEIGPVFIIDHGTPTHVLLSYADYHCLLVQQSSIASRLAMPAASDVVEFEASRVNIGIRPADFS